MKYRHIITMHTCIVIVLGDYDDSSADSIVSRILTSRQLGNKLVREIEPTCIFVQRSLQVDVLHAIVQSVRVDFSYIYHQDLLPMLDDHGMNKIVLAVCTTADYTDRIMEFIRLSNNLLKHQVFAIAHESFSSTNIHEYDNLVGHYIEHFDKNPIYCLSRILKTYLENSCSTHIVRAPIIAERVVMSISVYLQIIDNCFIEYNDAIKIILAYSFTNQSGMLISRYDKPYRYLISTTLGHVELNFVSSTDDPTVHAVVCTRHASLTLPDRTTVSHIPFIIYLLSDRDECTTTDCECDCNADWSSYKSKLQCRLRASATVDIPTTLVPFELSALLNIFVNHGCVTYTPFTL